MVDPIVHDEMSGVSQALKELHETIVNDINRFTEKEFIELLLPLLELADKLELPRWFAYSGGPFRPIAIMDNDDINKELFRIPPIIPSYKVPDRGEGPNPSEICDHVQNVQHLGPLAPRLLTSELQKQGDMMRKKGLVDEEQQAWEYIFNTYAKPRLLQREAHENNTNVSTSSEISFEDEDI